MGKSRASAGSWLLGASQLLIMYWAQSEFMIDGNGCACKKYLKVHTLNASMRLTHDLEHNPFPMHDDLREHLQAEANDHKVSLEAISATADIALGWRSEFLYRQRLGLSQNESHLIAADPRGHVPPHAITGSLFTTAWRNSVRSVLQKGFMFRISQRPETLVYVSENKSLAGKEDKATDGEASGRKLVVTFFEDGDDGLAHRVDREGSALRPQLLNIAEMLQALCFALPPDPERTAATTELLMEEHY